MADEKKPKAGKAPKDDKAAKPAKAEASAAAAGGAPAQKPDKPQKGKSDRGDKGGDKKPAGQQSAAPKGPVRMRSHFDEVVRKALTEKFAYKNAMQVPAIDKVVINMGIGEAVNDRKKVESAAADSTFLRSATASPMPMLITTLSIMGTCMAFL